MSDLELAKQIFVGNTEMAQRMRDHDWSKTTIGRLDQWPQSLRTTVSICLASRFPMLLWWGPSLSVLYNDAYIPIFANKHPWVLGRTGQEAWGEVWNVIGPMFDRVMRFGEATWSDDQLLELLRRGFVEETYFTWSYSPIRDETGGVGGVFTAVIETTDRVLSARRLTTLRELSEQAFRAMAVEPAVQLAAATLARNAADVPFAVLYLRRGADSIFDRVAASGMPLPDDLSPATLDPTHWSISDVVATGKACTLDLPRHIGPIPSGRWPEPVARVHVLPLTGSQDHAAGLLIAGLSPRLAFDDAYRGFLELVARHIAQAIATAGAYEDERRRAEALAELDRAKTTFFSNVSHEFRTPLTLILGPLSDATQSAEELPASLREPLALAHRNSLRLLKLVNTLLDFSRIEAGRVAARFEPVDLGALTGDLSSVFRSAMERAGLRFDVECPSTPEPVFVDREMWEKIVSNLLSNAIKYTLEGQVRLRLSADKSHARLIVSDTGVGIPASELPRLFERFHRVEGTPGRTQEGTGIGLALVHELVRLHGGTVSVESEVGRGTTFTVAIPFGSAHLPQDRIGAPQTLTSTALRAGSFADEAMRWLPDPRTPVAAEQRDELQKSPPVAWGSGRQRPTVLLADDNADMRAYVRGLLAGVCDVLTVGDGEEALRVAREQAPNLVLSDVMMPKIDGFELLRFLRTDQRTAAIPVILLSARAGEESRVEGLQAGADDYITKPFGARELITKVSSALALAAAREQLLDAERAARRDAERVNRMKDEFLATLSHELRTPLNAILGWAQILDRDGEDPVDLKKGLAAINRNARAQTQMIEDLLDMSRIVSGKVRLDVQRLALAEVIEQAVQSALPAATARGIRIEQILDPRAGPMSGDPARLQQVFWNLLSNAVKFTPRGGKVQIVLERVNSHVEVSVTDTGEGIAPDMLPFVFERFRQADASTTRSRGGLGLGLSIVKELVELHGGSVTASSPGRNLGATFIVKLPLLAVVDFLPADPARRHPLVNRSAQDEGLRPDLRGVSVLVIDDDEDCRQLVGRILEDCGATVLTAANARDGLDTLRRRRPDLLISDIGMPGQDGYDLIRQIRSLSQREGGAVPAVALTAYARSEDRQRALRAGFQMHIAKPVEQAELWTVCASITGKLKS